MPTARREVPAIPVRQWLEVWNEVNFEASAHRRKPPKHFYVLSMRANDLRSLCDIRRRDAAAGSARRNDLGIQRRHNEARSLEISEYVKHGFPWSALSESSRKSGQYDDLRKPGWLPTAIVVNVLDASDVREGKAVAAEDLIEIKSTAKGSSLLLPSKLGAAWRPKRTAPIEVIDGQHRLWAFEEDDPVDGDFEFPVVAFHGLDISWQAYLFYVINIKPAKINTSLGFDLYPLLRTEDWLEHAGGPTIYRESRAQELTEALWSYPESPWYQRIDMLGDSGRRQVTQAAWIRSLLATFVKKWESTRVPIGGLFGAPAGKDEAVLPWTRSQQAAFLITAWAHLRDAIVASEADWAVKLREAQPEEPDPAFAGPTTLPNTDQGVRAVLAVFNDLCYLSADDLDLRRWPANEFAEATSDIGLRDAIGSLRRRKADGYLKDIGNELATYDWRTSAAPGLSDRERSAKGRFRGSTGYRELRLDLLGHLSRSKIERVAAASKQVVRFINPDDQ